MMKKVIHWLLVHASAKYLNNLHSSVRNELETVILGKKFILCPRVFSPVGTMTSEFLARHLVVNLGDIVLDLGTGTGIQAIIAAEKTRKVVASDINPHAVSCAKKNVQLNYLEDKIKVREGDLFQPVKHEHFDLIIWSPPYLPLEYHSILERSWCCGENSELIERFLYEAKEHLTNNGKIEAVYSTIGNISTLLTKAESENYNVSIVASIEAPLEKIKVFIFTPIRDII